MLKIVIGAHQIAGRTGSELYVAELAQALKQRGVVVALFCLFAGAQAAALRAEGIDVFDASNVEAIRRFAPDIVHTHHVTMFHLAAEMLPGVPIVHGLLGVLPELEQLPVGWQEARRLVVVSERLRRLVASRTRTNAPIELVQNWFDDSEELAPAQAWLPPDDAVHRILVVSNHVSRERDQALNELVRLKRAVITRVGGLHGQRQVTSRLIAAHDVVITMGRTVLLAAATGVPVIVADQHLSDGLLKADNVDELAAWNFTGRAHRHALTAAHLWSEILQSKRMDREALSRRMRADYGLSQRARQFIDIYQRVLAEPSAPLRARRGEGLVYLQMAREIQRLRPAAAWAAAPAKAGRNLSLRAQAFARRMLRR